MPVLNEEKNLPRTLSLLKLSENEELIVIDGDSSDNTVSVAKGFTDSVLVTGKGRGRQMNLGAEKADGSLLLFLHADCILPDTGFAAIRQTLKNADVSAGAFDLSIDHPDFSYRIIEVGANLRSRATSIPYGDQGLFMRKDVFMKVGGFADIPLMEDIEISRRLKNIGRIVFVRPPIRTSPRRWVKEGPLYTTGRDWAIALSYALFKKSPESLVKYYRDVR
jgi:rSAM/selenodomain-associated transferase 2